MKKRIKKNMKLNSGDKYVSKKIKEFLEIKRDSNELNRLVIEFEEEIESEFENMDVIGIE